MNQSAILAAGTGQAEPGQPAPPRAKMPRRGSLGYDRPRAISRQSGHLSHCLATF
jgi:hypothetical protein